MPVLCAVRYCLSAICYALCCLGRHCGGTLRYPPMRVLCDVRYCFSAIWYALSGTAWALSAMRSPVPS
eukprot:498818-Rhodomonas_salina.1